MSFFDTLDPTIKTHVHQWLHEPFDIDTRQAVKELLEHNHEELKNAFHGHLSFGTAGLRSIMGVGTNRLNIYTIREATQGLADYILLFSHAVEPSCVIGYDSRHHSKLFAEETARVLAGNHIKVFLAPDITPTPFVSFACRYTSSAAAIMITASHNPPEYNGYKVYWSDGAQVVPPHDSGIMHHIERVQKHGKIHLSKLNDPLIQTLDAKVYEMYLEEIEKLQNYPTQNDKEGSRLKFVYSPLHGTGGYLLPRALERFGIRNVLFVEKQMIPDGNFSTVLSPNPEDPKALAMGSELMLETASDLFIATDPDADRLGLAVRHHNKSILLNGNQTGAIILYHLLKTYKEQHRLGSNLAVVSTIVTTELLSKMCKFFKVKYFETLTGFKYIGEKINQWEQHPDPLEFLFGAEESYGYLYGTHARDKDAIIASCVLAEAALCQKLKGLTLIDLLYEVYKIFGVFEEMQLSISFKNGADTMAKIKTMMTHLRSSPPKQLAHQQVIYTADYLKSEAIDYMTHKKEKLTLPSSDVLLLRLENSSKLIIRPSGTEPKIKLYAMASSSDAQHIEQTKTTLNAFLNNLLEETKTLLTSL